jgi:hypothetical protein
MQGSCKRFILHPQPSLRAAVLDLLGDYPAENRHAQYGSARSLRRGTDRSPYPP